MKQCGKCIKSTTRVAITKTVTADRHNIFLLFRFSSWQYSFAKNNIFSYKKHFLMWQIIKFGNNFFYGERSWPVQILNDLPLAQHTHTCVYVNDNVNIYKLCSYIYISTYKLSSIWPKYKQYIINSFLNSLWDLRQELINFGEKKRKFQSLHPSCTETISKCL